MHSAVSSSKRRARLPSQARGVLLALCIFTSLLSLITAVRADAQSQFRLKAPSRQNWSSDDAGVGPAAADAFDSHPGHGYLTSSFDSPASRNLIDILAESEEHTVFVRLLQRARLLPTLNLLQASDDGRGLTILAPTNDAIARKADEESRARKSSIAQQQLKQGAYNIERASKALGMWEWAIELSRLPTPPPSGDDHEYDQAGYIWSGRQGAPNLLENINAALRQQLLYHILNYTLPYNTSSATASESSRPSQPALHETLHLPSRKLLKEPTRPGPIPHPPEGPPHPGAEDQGGLLGGEGQKLRISWRTIGKGDFAAGGDNGEWANTARKEGALFFGTDAQGKGGARGLKQDWTSNKGVVVSVDAVLELPPDLATALQSHPLLSKLTELLPPEMLETLSTTAHLTLFLPSSTAFDSLSRPEWRYLNGRWPQAALDRVRLWGWHASGLGLGQGKVGYAERLRDQGTLNVTTIIGGEVTVAEHKNGHLFVDGAQIIDEDILTENGVIHVVDHLLLPTNDLNLSVEKYLLALNASRFVGLMHQAGLASYIDRAPHPGDDETPAQEPFTVLAPRDDVIDEWLAPHEAKNAGWGRRGNKDDAPPMGEEDLKELLKYHLVPGQFKPSNLSDGMLIGTELRDWRLKEGRQRIVVAVDDSHPGAEREGNGDVGFGDANVIADPVVVGNSIIYLISQLLEPPSNPIQTAVGTLALSTFVAAVFSAELDKPIKRAPGITYAVPNNDAFAALGLAMPYLLLPGQESRSELRSVVGYHAIDRILYMEDFANGARRYPTLEGSDIWAGKDKNGTVEIRRGTDGRNAQVIKGDILTNTGVIHEIDMVELPPTLDLTVGKLMRGAKAETMADLLRQAGYGWILNGTTPSSSDAHSTFRKDHRKTQEKRHRKRHKMLEDEAQSYVVLVPTDAAFTRINLTYYLNNPAALEALVQLHIIPSPADEVLPSGSAPQLPLALSDKSSFRSLLDSRLGGRSKYGELAFRQTHESGEDNLGWAVGIKGARGTDGKHDSARVLAFGRESIGSDRASLSKSTDDDNDVDAPPRSVGGVLTLDAVLLPYRPSWFYRWGWILLVCFGVGFVLAGIGWGCWVWWRRKDGRIRLPDAMDGEEE